MFHWITKPATLLLMVAIGQVHMFPASDKSDEVPLTPDGIVPHLALIRGGSPRRGLLVVTYNGSMGTICDDEFEDKEAQVACNQLGLMGLPHVTTVAQEDSIFELPESVAIHMDDITCEGDEKSLWDCRFGGWGIHNCKHNEDVVLSCGLVELVGDVPSRGIMVVTYHNKRGTICDDGFDDSEGRVACAQLGFGTLARISNVANSDFIEPMPEDYPVLMDNLQCTGSENTLWECPFRGWETHNCDQSEAVVLTCASGPTVSPGGPLQLELVGSKESNYGILVIHYNGTRGTICDDNFGQEEAQVACRVLGYRSVGRIQSFFGVTDITLPRDIKLIHMDEVSCIGNELDLASCSFRGWGSHDCEHVEDVVLTCENWMATTTEFIRPDDGELRLVGGPNPQSGRVEIYHDDEWGTVCDDGWDENSARVACRSLGYDGGQAFKEAYFGEGEGRIWIDEIGCSGDEPSLVDCTRYPWGISNCKHREDAGVSCTV